MKHLKRIVILAFNPPWLPMIQKGEKDLEFRDKIGKDWKEGTEVYLAITKNMGGSGMVEAKFTIGRIVEVEYDNSIPLFTRLDGRKEFMGIWYRKKGWNGQKYAIEIKDFEMLPEPIELVDIYAYNKVESEMVSFAKEFVGDFYSNAHLGIKKKKLAQYVDEMEENFLSNLHYYKVCKINRMPQSWCYGGVIQND